MLSKALRLTHLFVFSTRAHFAWSALAGWSPATQAQGEPSPVLSLHPVAAARASLPAQSARSERLAQARYQLGLSSRRPTAVTRRANGARFVVPSTPMTYRFAALSAALFLWASAGSGAESKMPPPAAGAIDFNKQVRPIFEAKCLGCHGKSQQQSGLRLDKRQNALRGGDYGAVISPGRSAESKIILRLVGPEAGLQMPPTGPLAPEEIGVLRAWIDQGAEFPDDPIAGKEHVTEKPLDPKVRAFLDAVDRGNAVAVRKALRSNRNLASAADNAQSTALMHAAAYGGLDVMRALLDAGAEPDARNKRGATALVWAVGNLQAVTLLLERGADPNVRTVEGRTPLLLAAMQPSGADVIRALLDKGADPLGKDLNGRVPLMAAAGTGSIESMRLLIARGARVNGAMESGGTPLLDAARSRNPAAVRFLIEQGADVNVRTKRGGSALDIAASWGSVEIVRMLLEKGARVDTRDDRGYSPLMYAAYSESMAADVVRMLLAKGADRKVTGEGETALSLAMKRGGTEIVRLLKAEAK